MLSNGVLPVSFKTALFPSQKRHCGCFHAEIVIAKSGLSFLVNFVCGSVNLELDCVCHRQEFGALAPTQETMPDQMALMGKMLLPSWALGNKTPT